MTIHPRGTLPLSSKKKKKKKKKKKHARGMNRKICTMPAVFQCAVLEPAVAFALPLVEEAVIHRPTELWNQLRLATVVLLCLTLREVLVTLIPCHHREITTSVTHTIVPIPHHIQMIHQVMGQDKVHDQSHEREEIPFHQYPNTDGDTRIPIHQGVTTGVIGMMALVGILVVNPTA